MQKAIVRQALKDKGITPTQEAMDKFNEEIENNQDYYAMAILITMEVAVAVVISIATWGAGAPTAATGGAAAVGETASASAINVATKVAETTMKEASEVAAKAVETTITQTTKALQKSAQVAVDEATQITEKVVEKTVKEATDVTQKVAQAAVKSATKAAESSTSSLDKAQKAFNLTQTIATTAKDLAMDGASIHTAVLQEENSENMANADKVKAYVKFLQQILKSDQEFLKELLEMQSNIADTTKGILQTEHSTNMHIANLTTHA
jgi:vacuolar-type H+-ATPase subunit H